MNEPTNSPRPLAKVIRNAGWTLTQIERKGNAAIYTQTKPGISTLFYEVIIIRTAPPRTFPNGQTAPFREYYPGNDEWGQFAWSYSDLPSAGRRFKSLQNQNGGGTFRDSSHPNAKTVQTTQTGLLDT